MTRTSETSLFGVSVWKTVDYEKYEKKCSKFVCFYVRVKCYRTTRLDTEIVIRNNYKKLSYYYYYRQNALKTKNEYIYDSIHDSSLDGNYTLRVYSAGGKRVTAAMKNGYEKRDYESGVATE